MVGGARPLRSQSVLVEKCTAYVSANHPASTLISALVSIEEDWKSRRTIQHIYELLLCLVRDEANIRQCVNSPFYHRISEYLRSRVGPRQNIGLPEILEILE